MLEQVELDVIVGSMSYTFGDFVSLCILKPRQSAHFAAVCIKVDL